MEVGIRMSDKIQVKLKCKNCNEVLESNAQFCHACGTRVAPSTCTCGAQLPEQAKFCTNCGSPATQPDSPTKKPEFVQEERQKQAPAVTSATGNTNISTSQPLQQPAFQQTEVVTERNMIGWYLEALKKYAVFTGRARRKEYWYFVLCNMIVVMILAFIGGLADLGDILANIYQLGVLLPGIAVGVRRMHDTGRNGWWLLLPLVNLVFATQDGTSGANKYGADPKGGVSDSNVGVVQPEQKKSSTKTVLVVLAVVLGGILLLGTIVAVPQFKEYRNKSFNSAATSDIRNAKTECEAYYADKQRYPESLSETGFKPAPDVVVDYSPVADYKSDGKNYQKYLITSYHQKGDRKMATTFDKPQIFFKLKNESDDAYKPM